MNEHIDVEKAIKLINNRCTTLDEICKFIYADIKEYQNERENLRLEEFRMEHLGEKDDVIEYQEEYTQELVKKIENDVKCFSVKYAENSIDVVLDAINQKRFKTKKRPKAFLALLCTLREVAEEG
jgi:hypothetical protein